MIAFKKKTLLLTKNNIVQFGYLSWYLLGNGFVNLAIAKQNKQTNKKQKEEKEEEQCALK